MKSNSFYLHLYLKAHRTLSVPPLKLAILINNVISILALSNEISIYDH